MLVIFECLSSPLYVHCDELIKSRVSLTNKEKPFISKNVSVLKAKEMEKGKWELRTSE